MLNLVTDVPLTDDEKHEVADIFTGLDTHGIDKVPHGSMYKLLSIVRGTYPDSSSEYQAISHSLYYDETNGFISKQNFFADATTLKNDNPMEFPGFLKGRSLAL